MTDRILALHLDEPDRWIDGVGHARDIVGQLPHVGGLLDRDAVLEALRGAVDDAVERGRR